MPGNKKKNGGPGRGWRGDSARHAIAGHLGGIARKKKRRGDQEESNSSRQ